MEYLEKKQLAAKKEFSTKGNLLLQDALPPKRQHTSKKDIPFLEEMEYRVSELLHYYPS